MRLDRWLTVTAGALQTAGVESASLEAQVLAAHALGQDRAWVLARPELELPEDFGAELVSRRLKREPLAYILGYREFFGRRFSVDQRVLIPRQETETLVEAALVTLPIHGVRILDVGTGSGCVAVTLALERPGWEVWASDVSKDAVELAQLNAKTLDAQVQLLEGDLLATGGPGQFDAIVSNPPYVEQAAKLMPEVGNYEPGWALFGGADGLHFYRRFALEVPPRLTPNGWLFLELGDAQGSAVVDLFRDWEDVQIQTDLGQVPRVLCARRPTC